MSFLCGIFKQSSKISTIRKILFSKVLSFQFLFSIKSLILKQITDKVTKSDLYCHVQIILSKSIKKKVHQASKLAENITEKDKKRLKGNAVPLSVTLKNLNFLIPSSLQLLQADRKPRRFPAAIFYLFPNCQKFENLPVRSKFHTLETKKSSQVCLNLDKICTFECFQVIVYGTYICMVF